MESRVSVAVFATVGLALLVLVVSAAPPPVVAQGITLAQAPRPEPLQREQLKPARPTAPLPREQSKPTGPTLPTGQVFQAEQLTKEQFDRLPDSQVIDVKGKRMTAGQIRAQVQKARAEAEAQAKAAAARAQAEFEAYRAKFLQEQKAKLDAENAKVQAEVTRLRQQPQPSAPPRRDDPKLNAIRQEARQLLGRAKTASPAEQAQIEQRAEQLLGQLEQMGLRRSTAPLERPGVQPPGQLPRRP